MLMHRGPPLPFDNSLPGIVWTFIPLLDKHVVCYVVAIIGYYFTWSYGEGV